MLRDIVNLDDETELETSQPRDTGMAPDRAQLVKDSTAMPASVARLVEVNLLTTEMIQTLLRHVMEMMAGQDGPQVEAARPETGLEAMAEVEEGERTQRSLLQGVPMLMQPPTVRAAKLPLGLAFLATLSLSGWLLT